MVRFFSTVLDILGFGVMTLDIYPRTPPLNMNHALSYQYDANTCLLAAAFYQKIFPVFP